MQSVENILLSRDVQVCDDNFNYSLLDEFFFIGVARRSANDPITTSDNVAYGLHSFSHTRLPTAAAAGK